jgi:hypothetical protein
MSQWPRIAERMLEGTLPTLHDAMSYCIDAALERAAGPQDFGVLSALRLALESLLSVLLHMTRFS